MNYVSVFFQQQFVDCSFPKKGNDNKNTWDSLYTDWKESCTKCLKLNDFVITIKETWLFGYFCGSKFVKPIFLNRIYAGNLLLSVACSGELETQSFCVWDPRTYLLGFGFLITCLINMSPKVKECEWVCHWSSSQNKKYTKICCINDDVR